MNETKILEMDPIAIAEEFLGKPCDECDSDSDLSSVLDVSATVGQIKRDCLSAHSDTHMCISWKEFLEIAKDLGFEPGLVKKFCGYSVEEEILFFHKEKGLILYATSYNANRINSAKVYGQVKANWPLTSKQFSALESYGRTADGNIHFEFDVRKGFRSKLNAISNVFDYMPQWTEVPFLWFLNYAEELSQSGTYAEISKLKAMSIPEVAHIIYGL